MYLNDDNIIIYDCLGDGKLFADIFCSHIAAETDFTRSLLDHLKWSYGNTAPVLQNNRTQWTGSAYFLQRMDGLPYFLQVNNLVLVYPMTILDGPMTIWTGSIILLTGEI